jgi:hypothetical protein
LPKARVSKRHIMAIHHLFVIVSPSHPFHSSAFCCLRTFY